MPELRLTVTARRAVAERVIALDLSDPAGAALPPWTPGAHLDLILASGVERQFSLCGDPADSSIWRIAVLRETAGRGGSREVHDTLTEGSPVRVRGPRNHFRLEPAGRYIFIAGGIGITPILPMLAAAESAGRPWTLHYGGRTGASMAFSRELAARYGQQQVRLWPQDQAGLLDLPAILGRPAQGTLVYCCGPGPLLDAVQHCQDWPAGTLHMERFTPQDTAPAAGEEFAVELAQAGLTLTVPPGQSILQTVQDAGVPVLFSCTEGTCGTCETAVLDGIPDHRDSVLTAAERAASDSMMICVSRSVTAKLVLDL